MLYGSFCGLLQEQIDQETFVFFFDWVKRTRKMFNATLTTVFEIVTDKTQPSERTLSYSISRQLTYSLSCTLRNVPVWWWRRQWTRLYTIDDHMDPYTLTHSRVLIYFKKNKMNKKKFFFHIIYWIWYCFKKIFFKSLIIGESNLAIILSLITMSRNQGCNKYLLDSNPIFSKCLMLII